MAASARRASSIADRRRGAGQCEEPEGVNASGVEEHERVERVNSRRARHKHVTDTPSRAPSTRTSTRRRIMQATFLCASMLDTVPVETVWRVTSPRSISPVSRLLRSVTLPSLLPLHRSPCLRAALTGIRQDEWCTLQYFLYLRIRR